MTLGPLLTPELREMLDTNDAGGLREFCEAIHPSSVAEFMEELSVAQTWKVLSHAEPKRQAAIFEYFPPTRQHELIGGAERNQLARLIEAMEPDDRASLVRSLDERLREELLPLVAAAEREDIRRLLQYPENSAGSIMTSNYAWLPEDITEAEALVRLRQQAPDRETIYYVYVLDSERRLTGIVSLRGLIVGRPSDRVSDQMSRKVVSVRVDEDKEDVARKFAQYDFLALPVVDQENRLVGMITHDDVLDVVVDEATEDVHRMGAVGPGVENHLAAPFVTVWRKRVLWLSCLFIAELATFTALSHFEDAIEAVVVLALFVPLCISTGGNSGSQAATLITRSLALGHITVRDWRRVLRHELLMGLALGVALGAIGFARAALTTQAVLGEASRWQLALVISQSVMAICLWGTVIGSLLPLLFKRLGFDPGMASSPFVATFVDVTGIIIYFSFAKLYLL
jgi:magnesium transporter